ncbi:MAG: acyltransferase domain-containing protein [Neisseriales bacterium]|nr:MAG: acyltransferase domain-containing protein [Neisseriales bacterium]
MGLAIIFSGQGNQHKQMFARFQSELDLSLIKTVEKNISCSLLPEITLDDNDFFSNQYAQPIISSYEYILWQTIHDKLPEPVAVAGYSLGEITAIAAAISLELNELLVLTKARASLMATSKPSGLVAVSGIRSDQIDLILVKHNCYLAIKTSEQSFIVGGYSKDLLQLEAELKSLPGMLSIHSLKVSVAAHTPLLTDKVAPFVSLFNNYSHKLLNLRVVSGTNAAVQYSTSAAINAACNQLAQTINFDRLVNVLVELGATTVLEIGPSKAIQNIVHKLNPRVKVRSIEDFRSLSEVVEWVSKMGEMNSY